MEIKRVTPIEPELSRCISVNSTNKLFTIGESGNLLTHNSVSQQNIIFSVVSYSSLTMIYYYYSSKIKVILCSPPPICNLT